MNIQTPDDASTFNALTRRPISSSLVRERMKAGTPFSYSCPVSRGRLRVLCVLVLQLVGAASLGMTATQYDLAFATYFGGANFDSIRDVCVDSQGNIIAAGGTSSTNFPTTPGAYNRTYNAGYTSGTPGSIGSFGPMDAFVAKFDSGGRLLWSTYLGGRDYDRAYGVEVDPQGNIYVAGRAGEGFPVTAGAFHTKFVDYSGGNLGAYGKENGFVAKFSSAGQLLWASYVGWELCRDIAVDDQGDIYLPSGWNGVGPTLPASWFTNGFQKTPKGGGADVCVLKIKSDGSQVLWGTWLCGTGNDKPASSIRVDAAKNVYWAGYTSSTDMSTAGNGRRTYLGGPNDFYLAKLSPDGSNLI